MPHEALDTGRVRELGRPAEAPEAAVIEAPELGPRLEEGRVVEHRLPGRRGTLVQGLPQGLALLAGVLGVLAEEPRHPGQHLFEARQAVVRLAREIGPAEKRRVVPGRQEHGQGPAAIAPAQEVVGHLIDLVEVGPLLAVHLDVHEVLVHERRGGLVLEGLVGHDVAPVAGRIPDGEQNRFVLRASALQRLRSPRVPGDRVVGVLEKIRAGFVRQGVHRWFLRRIITQNPG